jgi:hypothetical protein
MAEADIPAQEPLSNRSITRSSRSAKSSYIHFAPQNYQPIRETCRIADRHPALRAQIHAWQIQHVERLRGMILVVPFDRLFKLRQRPQFVVAFKFLLALAAGENDLAFPGHRVSFRVVCHS